MLIKMFRNKKIVKCFSCLVVIFIIFIFQSCSTISKSERDRLERASFAAQNKGCCVEKVYLGATINLNRNNEIEITSVAKDSPASGAGLLPGDVILKVDDVDLKNRYQAFMLYDGKYSGTVISMTVKREGTVIKKQFQLSSHHFLNVEYSLLELVYKDIPVRLAVIFGDVDYGHPALKEYFGKQESYWIGLIESKFLSTFRNQNNFSLIDRQKTQAVLNELKFQSSGLVDKKSREELGKMLGATHLFVMDISLSGSEDKENEYLYVIRLIEIVTGKTLSVSTFRNKVNESIDFVLIDLKSYHEKIRNIQNLEEEALNAYLNVMGANYKDEPTVLNALNNIVIPKYQAYYQLLIQISPSTPEVGKVHQLYIDGVNLQLQGLKIYIKAITQKDKKLTETGNQNMRLGSKKIEESREEAGKLLNR